MKLGFAVTQRPGPGDKPLDFLSFTWLVNGKEHTLATHVTADPDFAALDLCKMADGIRARTREARQSETGKLEARKARKARREELLRDALDCEEDP